MILNGAYPSADVRLETELYVEEHRDSSLLTMSQLMDVAAEEEWSRSFRNIVALMTKTPVPKDVHDLGCYINYIISSHLSCELSSSS